MRRKDIVLQSAYGYAMPEPVPEPESELEVTQTKDATVPDARTIDIFNGYVVAKKDGDTAIVIGRTVITFTDAGGYTIYERDRLPIGLEMVERLKQTGHF